MREGGVYWKHIFLPGSAGRRRRLMLTINVAPDGSGQFTTISEAVLAVPYD